ncbi:MAG: hypothetical protein ABWW69_02470 [Pyrodictiaceae archaeon]
MEELTLPKRRLVPPRPEVSSLSIASLLALLVFALVGDVTATTIAWVLGFLFSLPFAIMFREFVFLSGTEPIEPEEASKLLYWSTIAARAMGSPETVLFYTTRTRIGFQLVGLGSFRQENVQGKIPFLAHKAAWVGAPVAELDLKANTVYLVVPALVLERASRLIRKEGFKLVMSISSLRDAKLAYSLIKAIAYALYGSRRMAAYIATKLFSRLILEGHIVVEADGLIEDISARMPFEDPITRRAVRKQLRSEMIESLL